MDEKKLTREEAERLIAFKRQIDDAAAALAVLYKELPHHGSWFVKVWPKTDYDGLLKAVGMAYGCLSNYCDPQHTPNHGPKP